MLKDQQRIQELQKNLQALSHQLEREQAANSDLSSQISEQKQQIQDGESMLMRCQSELKVLLEKVCEKEKAILNQQDQILSLGDKESANAEAIAEQENQIQNLKVDLLNEQLAHSQVKSELQKIHVQHERDLKELQERKDRLDTLDTSIKHNEDAKNALHQKLESTVRKLEAISSLSTKQEAEIVELKKQMEVHNAGEEELRARIDSLNEQIKTEESAKAEL